MYESMMDRVLGLLIKLFIFISGFAKELSRRGIGTYEEWVPGTKLKLLMVGYNGARNTGADARVVAAVKQIKELFGTDDVQLTVLTLSKKALEGYFDEDAASRETTERMLREHGWNGRKPLLGIAVINPFIWPVRASLRKWIQSGLTGKHEGRYDKWYYYSDSSERRIDYDRHIDEIAKAVNTLCEKEDFFPVILGMEKMDVDACQKLKQKLKAPAAVFASGDHTAEIMTGILLDLSVLITSRYHAAVLSMRNGCPIVAVSMDERLDSLMKEIKMDDGYLFHVWDENLGVQLTGAAQKGDTQKKEIREHLEQKVQEYREEQIAMGAFLKRYITDRLEGAEN